MLHRHPGKILTLALLLALSLPALVTAAIAVHEAAHHRHDGPSGELLFTAVHGHHHDQAIEEHAHEAVAAKIRAGAKAETPAEQALGADLYVDDISRHFGRSVSSRPLLEPPRSSALCIWQL